MPKNNRIICGALTLLLFLLMNLVGCGNDKQPGTNPVLNYLENAEIQYEGETQKENIIVALNDVLNLSEKQLKTRKYKNYSGQENQWDLPTLIYKHFVPAVKSKTLGNNFYRDVKSTKVQDQIRKILEELKQ